MEIVDPPAELDRPDDGLRVVAFGPPRGYSSGEIGTAKFLVDRTEPRFPSIHTYWRPTAAELEQLQAGAVLQFSMVANIPPPVSAAVYVAPPEWQPKPDPCDDCSEIEELRGEVATGRCGGCGHRMSEHGRNGCAADDEAAMGGCDCPATTPRPTDG